jgi:hypothetical protein
MSSGAVISGSGTSTSSGATSYFGSCTAFIADPPR